MLLFLLLLPALSLAQGANPEEFPAFTAKLSDDALDRYRQEAVRDSLLWAWNIYWNSSLGHDEHDSLLNRPNDFLGGYGLMLVETIDTLLIMGLEEEARKAIDYYVIKCSWKNPLTQSAKDAMVSVFETIIRHLGGALSAYGLTGDRRLLNHAVVLGDMILSASRQPGPVTASNWLSYLPPAKINFRSCWQNGDNIPRCRKSSPEYILANPGTLQLEFKALSYFSGNPIYAAYAEFYSEIVSRFGASGRPDMPNSSLKSKNLNGIGSLSFGASGDSYFEYLMKQWVQDRGDRRSRDEYWRVLDELDYVLNYSIPNNYLYITELSGGRKLSKMDHLACFVPGMLALGAHHEWETNPHTANYPRIRRDLRRAEELTNTCYHFYANGPFGLSGDAFSFDITRGPNIVDFFSSSDPYYLRPEVIESLFIMYRVTGNTTYKDWAWNIFLAINQTCRSTYGFSMVNRQTGEKFIPGAGLSSQPSYFFAESLKYLYLIFGPDDVIPLDKYVFNTEAHPLLIFTSPPQKISWESLQASSPAPPPSPPTRRTQRGMAREHTQSQRRPRTAQRRGSA